MTARIFLLVYNISSTLQLVTCFIIYSTPSLFYFSVLNFKIGKVVPSFLIFRNFFIIKGKFHREQIVAFLLETG